jgi:hypothetical protein
VPEHPDGSTIHDAQHIVPEAKDDILGRRRAAQRPYVHAALREAIEAMVGQGVGAEPGQNVEAATIRIERDGIETALWLLADVCDAILSIQQGIFALAKAKRWRKQINNGFRNVVAVFVVPLDVRHRSQWEQQCARRLT